MESKEKSSKPSIEEKTSHEETGGKQKRKEYNYNITLSFIYLYTFFY